jgi:DNA repair photolyase
MIILGKAPLTPHIGLLEKKRGRMNKKFDAERKGTGTREWSEESRNIGNTCSHACVYCYACYNAVNRWKKIKSKKEFMKEVVNEKQVNKKEHKVNGVVMFPTAHDITPYYLPYAEKKILNLLKAGNEVLIVSKPHAYCIGLLCEHLVDYKDKVMFRFSIGTLDEAVAKKWEPGAPEIVERIQSLRTAFDNGYKTSVSCEPVLPVKEGYCEAGIKLYNEMERYVTDTIWFGKLNKPEQRIMTRSKKLDKELIKEVNEFQSDEAILEFVKIIGGRDKVAWKDSVKEIIKKGEKQNGNEI